MNVAVAPEAQNQGIGGRLLTAALSKIAATKLRKLFV